MSPGPHAQHDLLSHETPGHVGVEGDVDEEFRRGEEESRGDEGYLGGVVFVVGALVADAGVDSYDLGFHVRRGEFASAESGSGGGTVIGGEFAVVGFSESGGIAGQDGLGEGFGGSEFRDVEVVPMGVEFQVAVDLDEVCLSRPELGGVVARHGRSEAFVFVEVEDAYLSAVAEAAVGGGGAELVDAVAVGRRVGDFGGVAAVFVLADHLGAGAALDAVFAGVGVQAEAVLDDGADEEAVGALGLVEGPFEGVAQQVVAEGGEGDEDGVVVSNGEDGSAAVGVFEGLQVLPGQGDEGRVDVVALGSMGRRAGGQRAVRFVERREEVLEDEGDARDGGPAAREGVADQLLGVGGVVGKDGLEVEEGGERGQIVGVGGVVGVAVVGVVVGLELVGIQIIRIQIIGIQII